MNEKLFIPELEDLSTACRKLRILLDRSISDVEALNRCAEIDRAEGKNGGAA
jgi:hypothetical protein